jgi:cytidylate kinase
VAEVATALTARDEIDRTRTASPLYAAPDAVVVDTTGKSVQQVVTEVLGILNRKRAEGGGQRAGG